MQMGLALPMAYYFHRATTTGLPANLVVVPMTQLMMPAAVAALGLGYVAPVLAKLPALVTSLALVWITGTVRELGSLRLADLRVAMPSLLLSTLAAAALIIALLTARKRAVLTIAGLTTLLLTSFALAFLRPQPLRHPDTLEVTSIDVGEGDSTLLVTPQGRTMLIDAGGRSVRVDLNSTLARMSSLHIYGLAESPVSTWWPSLTDTPITSAA